MCAKMSGQGVVSVVKSLAVQYMQCVFISSNYSYFLRSVSFPFVLFSPPSNLFPCNTKKKWDADRVRRCCNV